MQTHAAGQQASELTGRLKVMQMNVLHANTSFEKAAQVIRDWNPDIVSLQELNPAWQAALKPVLSSYSYRFVLPEGGHTSSRALYSRYPFLTFQSVSLAKSAAPGIKASILWQGRKLTVIALHPLPPVTPQWYEQRVEQLVTLARIRPSLDSNLLVIGDLNNSPFSPSFKRFLREGQLKDTRVGFGYQATWPSFFPPLQIPIDHVLTSPEWVVLNRQVGPFTGSDHFPILVELALPAQAHVNSDPKHI